MFDGRRFSIALPMTNTPLASNQSCALRRVLAPTPHYFCFFLTCLTCIIYSNPKPGYALPLDFARLVQAFDA
jgi:hypothetical protein